ncbi:hypothetical protein AVEN_207356-1 [Araneus ventricosus]|uniref:Uncharacterized protein n=1 Tax=Araneus ventricosus TaxID=182803 RepID=A0A4Y2VK63_ARAVE|nr:hypothetical protein AVEN_207356-1 [Araneus ventricosus]
MGFKNEKRHSLFLLCRVGLLPGPADVVPSAGTSVNEPFLLVIELSSSSVTGGHLGSSLPLHETPVFSTLFMAGQIHTSLTHRAEPLPIGSIYLFELRLYYQLLVARILLIRTEGIS